MILIAIKVVNAKAKVTIKWLVTVKLYGTKPITLEIKMKQKRVKM